MTCICIWHVAYGMLHMACCICHVAYAGHGGLRDGRQYLVVDHGELDSGMAAGRHVQLLLPSPCFPPQPPAPPRYDAGQSPFRAARPGHSHIHMQSDRIRHGLRCLGLPAPSTGPPADNAPSPTLSPTDPVPHRSASR